MKQHVQTVISKKVYIDREELDEYLVRLLAQARNDWGRVSDAHKADRKNATKAYRKGLVVGRWKLIDDLRKQIN